MRIPLLLILSLLAQGERALASENLHETNNGGWKDWSVCNAVRRIPIQDPDQQVPLNADLLHDDRSLRQHDIRGLAPKIRHGCMRAARGERHECFCYGHYKKTRQGCPRSETSRPGLELPSPDR
ncbi:hypothetical protein V2G26_014206 [Clonostachys chloroleuca]